MALLVATPDRDGHALAERLRRHLPDADIRVWPDIGDEASIAQFRAYRNAILLEETRTADLQTKHRLGLSATPVRESDDEEEIFTLIGPPIGTDWTKLFDAGYVAEPEVEIRLVPWGSEMHRNEYGSAEGHEKRQLAAMNPAKAEEVREILRAHPGEKALVFVDYLDQGDAIADALDVPFVSGDTAHIERERLFDEFRRLGGSVFVDLVWNHNGFSDRSTLDGAFQNAGGSIALLFVAGFLYTPQTNIVVTEFWRWWVVHMWVEGAFEFFIVAVVGLTLVSMNLLSKRSAEKAVLLEALFVMGTGVIGVSHHYWWIGMPDLWVPIGSVFSTLELVPLVFILFEAINEYRAMVGAGESFPYSLPFAFIVASGLWNFVGAGVLGFFINLPLINYYEHGTYLTVGHAHAAMFGAFGFLALGMATYMLRLAVKERHWSTRRLRAAFWLWNAGLALMVFVSVLPVGVLQLETAFTVTYDAARSLAFYEQPVVQALFWARLPGDTLLILGTLVFAYDVVAKLRHLRPSVTSDEERRRSPAVVLGDD